MKKLFKLIFGLIAGVIILAIVIVVATFVLLRDNTQAPVDEFHANQNIVLVDELANSFDDYFSGQTTSINASITQGNFNGIIYKKILEKNPNYLQGTDTASNDYKYISHQNEFGIRGIWVEFADKQIIITLGIDSLLGFRFPSAARLYLGLDLEAAPENEIVVSIEKIKLGKIGISKGGLFTRLLKKSGVDVSNEINEFLKDSNGESFGYFNQDELEISVYKDKLLGMLSDDSSALNVFKALFDLSEKNELLSLSLKKTGLEIDLDLNKMKDNDSLYQVPEAERITTEEQLNQMLANKSLDLVLSAHAKQADNFYIQLTENEVNKIIDYYMKDQVMGAKTIELGSKMLVMETLTPVMVVLNNKLFFAIKLKMYFEDTPGEAFETILKMEATPTVNNNDLVFVLGDLSAGETSLSAQDLDGILALLGNSDILSDGELVIPDFANQFSTDQLVFSQMTVSSGYIKMDFTGKDQDANDLILEVQNVIKDAINNVVEPNLIVKDELIAFAARSLVNSSHLKNTLDVIKAELTSNQENLLLAQLMLLIDAELPVGKSVTFLVVSP
jgi:hypothetical protein